MQSQPVPSQVLDLMAAQGKNRAVGFIGPFDAVLREGSSESMMQGIDALISAAADKGVAMGRVCGSGRVCEPLAIEEQMAAAISIGCRLVCVHYMTSDLPYKGAEAVARPFFQACGRGRAPSKL